MIFKTLARKRASVFFGNSNHFWTGAPGVADYFNSNSLSWRVARVGGVLRSLLMFICGAVLLGGAAIILEPSALIAISQRPEHAKSSQKLHDDFADTLSALLANCVEILAINNHTPSSQASIVLWVEDKTNVGQIDPQEIAVISHNQLLRSITVYSMDEQAAEPEASEAAATKPKPPEPGVVKTDNKVAIAGHSIPGARGVEKGGRPVAVRLGAPLDRTAITAGVFCDRWRATPSVKPRIIASGISDMRVEPLAGHEIDLQLLRLSLRWSPDSTDGAGEATALIQHRKE